MKVRLLVFFIVFIVASSCCFAQKHFSISGLVKWGDIGISDAKITILPNKQTLLTDSAGRYKLALKAGTYIFEINAENYGTLKQQVKVYADSEHNFELKLLVQNLNEVVISSQKEERSLKAPQMGVERLSMQTIKNIPLLFGERDLMKAIQLLPGIKSAGEGSSGIFVRGGAADQNLILLNDVPVYNASHLLGFFSTFNPDAVDDVTVYKTAMPASYGGRLSSVLSVNTKEGDNEAFAVAGGVGLISSKLTLSGPIQKGASSFLVSARRTYVDALLKLSPDSNINSNIIYFYDLNASADFKLSLKDRLSFTGYFGNDKLGFADAFSLGWGNSLASVKWRHLFNSAFSSETNLSFTGYKTTMHIASDGDNINLLSKLSDRSLKQAFSWQQANNHTLKFGANAIYHSITPGQLTSEKGLKYNDVHYQERFALTSAIYASSEWLARPNLTLSTGVRATSFSIFGPGSFLQVDKDGAITNELKYQKGERVKNYVNIEPRFAASYLLNNQSSVKASYVRNTQNLHMIANSTSSRPTDKWLPSSLMVKPEVADQFAVGYYRDLFGNLLTLNVESYYKSMQNQIDYRDGADTFNADNIEMQLLYGIGRAYGLELLLKKKRGDFTGWLSYTLSKTERKIEGINQGNWYNARQDRTHELAMVGSYKLSTKWNLSATWTYYTGEAVTFPGGKYNLDSKVFFYYTERNGYRMPSYHRLDLGANMQLSNKANYKSELSFSLYNAYGRRNPYAISFREAETDPSKTEVVRTTLFRFLPSITYNFNF